MFAWVNSVVLALLLWCYLVTLWLFYCDCGGLLVILHDFCLMGLIRWVSLFVLLMIGVYVGLLVFDVLLQLFGIQLLCGGFVGWLYCYRFAV